MVEHSLAAVYDVHDTLEVRFSEFKILHCQFVLDIVTEERLDLVLDPLYDLLLLVLGRDRAVEEEEVLNDGLLCRLALGLVDLGQFITSSILVLLDRCVDEVADGDGAGSNGDKASFVFFNAFHCG